MFEYYFVPIIHKHNLQAQKLDKEIFQEKKVSTNRNTFGTFSCESSKLNSQYLQFVILFRLRVYRTLG